MTRELILGITHDKKHTDTIFFNKNENVLAIQPFSSQISGLQLVLKQLDGKKKTISIYETGVARTIENVGLFECFWFDYDVSDRDYFAQIMLS